MNISIIGGGAAGFFTAINLKKLNSDCSVVIYEASSSPLSKVKVSGGGRCNLTNSFKNGLPMIKLYPRGEKLMRSCFRKFNHLDTYKWFEENGVELITQSDNCVFPKSQQSLEIIDTFLALSKELGIKIQYRHRVEKIKKNGELFNLYFDGGSKVISSDYVVVTSGGSPRKEGVEFLKELPLEFIDPLPSLFSLNIPNNPITELSGAVIEKVNLSFKGHRQKSSGEMLITHWGVSGPAVLKLSSYCARKLSELSYRANLLIDWMGDVKEEDLHSKLSKTIAEHSKKLVVNINPFGFTSRVWQHILFRSDISPERRWIELGSKGLNRIVATLTGDEYQVDGRGINKEEFVTAGGVSLSSIDFDTLEARECSGLYFAGEVLDIDAITGGYNLQAAWSSGYSVALALSNSLTLKSGN